MGAYGRREILFGMAAAAAATAFSRPASAANQTLRELADAKGLSFGSAIDPELLDKPGYSQLILEQCNTIVPRNALKWDATERTSGGFQFGSADRAIAFAEENKLAVRGTTLIWYRSPGWVTRMEDPKTLTDAMTNHIST